MFSRVILLLSLFALFSSSKSQKKSNFLKKSSLLISQLAILETSAFPLVAPGSAFGALEKRICRWGCKYLDGDATSSVDFFATTGGAQPTLIHPSDAVVADVTSSVPVDATTSVPEAVSTASSSSASSSAPAEVTPTLVAAVSTSAPAESTASATQLGSFLPYNGGDGVPSNGALGSSPLGFPVAALCAIATVFLFAL
jgi:hypothetical protein